MDLAHVVLGGDPEHLIDLRSALVYLGLDVLADLGQPLVERRLLDLLLALLELAGDLIGDLFGALADFALDALTALVEPLADLADLVVEVPERLAHAVETGV